MRTLHAFFLMVLFLTGAFGIGYKYHSNGERERRAKLAENSYSAGCHLTALQLCARLDGDPREDCFSTALDMCDKDAEKFRKWIFRQ